MNTNNLTLLTKCPIELTLFLFSNAFPLTIFLTFQTNTTVLVILLKILSFWNRFVPFDDAKVRRFLQSRIIFSSFFAKKVLIIDTNQSSCVRAQQFCARTHWKTEQLLILEPGFYPIGQIHELLNGQLFGSEGQKRGMFIIERRVLGQHLPERHA